MTRAMAAMTAVRAPAFDPRNLGQLSLWLDARASQGFGVGQPVDGASVAQWNDLSGNVRHALQANGTKQPAFRTVDRNLLSDPNMDSISGTIVTRTNLVANPTIETNATGWSASDSPVGGVTRSTTQAERGTASLAMAGTGAFNRIASLGVGKIYAASAYVRPDIAGSYGIYGVSAPTPLVETLGKRYVMCRNGPGNFTEEASSNILSNGSMEPPVTTAAYGAMIGDMTRTMVTERAFMGTTSLKIIKTVGAAAAAGVSFGSTNYTIPVTVNKVLTFSAYIYSPIAINARCILDWRDSTNTTVGSTAGTTTAIPAGVWTRINVTGTALANTASVQPIVQCTSVMALNDFYYIDCAQLEEKAYATTYIDGSLGTGYTWDTTDNLLTHASAGGVNISAWSGGGPRTITDLGGGETRMVATGPSAQMRGLVNLADLVNGAYYFCSVTLRNDQGTAQQVTIDWNDTGGSMIYTVAAGATVRVGLAGMLATYTSTYRFLDIMATASDTNIIMSKPQIERRTYATPYNSSVTPASVAHATTASRVMNQLIYTVPSPAWSALTGAFVTKLGTGTAVGVQMDTSYGSDGTTNLIRTNITQSTGVVSVTPYLNGAGQTPVTVTLGACVVGDVISVAYVISGTTLTVYASKNGAAIVAGTGTTVLPDVAKPPNKVSLGYNYWNPSAGICTNAVYENVMLFNAALSDADARTLVLGTVVPSAAANRADCVFSATVNDAGAAPLSLAAGVWQKISRIWKQDKGTQTDVVILGPSNSSTHPSYIDSIMAEESDVILPYFDGSSTRIPIRRNLAKNPSFEVDTVYWTFTTRSTVRGMFGTACGTSTVGSAPQNDVVLLREGKVVTVSAYVWLDATVTNVSFHAQRWTNKGTTYQSGIGTPQGTSVTGVWVRLSQTVTLPTDSDSVNVFFTSTGTGIIYYDGILVEEGAVLGTYFDGTTVATQGLSYGWNGTAHQTQSEQFSPDYTYGWVGTAHATASQQKAPAMPGFLLGSTVAHYSTERSFVGLSSLKALWNTAGDSSQNIRVTPDLVTIIGQSYTFSTYVYIPTGSPDVRVQMGAGALIWGNVPKDTWTRLSGTFVAVATNTAMYVGVPRAAVKGDDIAYFDAMQVEIGAVTTAWTPRLTFPGGQPVIKYDDVDDILGISSAAGFGDLSTTYIIYRQNSPKVGGDGILVGDEVPVAYIGISGSGYNGYAYAGGSFITWVGAQAVTQLLSFVWNGANSNRSFNGVIGTNANIGASVPGNLNIGNHPAAGQHLDVDMIAVLIFTQVHDAVTRKRVERWLGSIYGISIAA